MAATATGTKGESSSAQVVAGGDRSVEVYTANLGVTSWEIDLFGRVRSLSAAAQQNYLATAEIGRSVRISLIAQTASAWLNLAADQDLLALAEETLRTRQETMRPDPAPVRGRARSRSWKSARPRP